MLCSLLLRQVALNALETGLLRFIFLSACVASVLIAVSKYSGGGTSCISCNRPDPVWTLRLSIFADANR